MSMGALLLCGGAPGKRFALPNAKIMIHQGSSGFQGTPTDIEIHAQEILSLRRRAAEIMARHCDRPVTQLEADMDRDRFMEPQEAKAYGLVDDILSDRKLRPLHPFTPGQAARRGSGNGERAGHTSDRT